MKKVIIVYKDFILKVHVSKNNTCILNSYKVKNINDMQDILYIIQNKIEDSNMAINKRGVWDMIHEWRAHNLLYSFGIEKDRTKSVDLEINQPWYKELGYKILSCFYFHF